MPQLPERIDPESLPDVDKLPELTPRQYQFVRGLLEGKSAADSFRAAYGAEGYGQNALWVQASRLGSHPKIRLWLNAARKARFETGIWSLSRYLHELMSLYALAIEKGNLTVAQSCLKAVGDSSGHNISRSVELDRDPLQLLKEIAAKNPEIAAQLAKSENLEQPQQLH